MKRRFLMVTAMMLLLGTQADMLAQKRGVQDQRRPGMEMHRPIDKKAICQGDVVRLQEFYRRKYKVKLSRAEAERILAAQMRERRDHHRHHDRPHMRPDRRHDRSFAQQGPHRRK